MQPHPSVFLPSLSSVGSERISVRAYSLDDHWELMKIRYHDSGRRVPQRWLNFYRLVCAILRWGAR